MGKDPVEAGATGFFGDRSFEEDCVSEVVVRGRRSRFDPQDHFPFGYRGRFFRHREGVAVDPDHVLGAGFCLERVLAFPAAKLRAFGGVAARHPRQAA